MTTGHSYWLQQTLRQTDFRGLYTYLQLIQMRKKSYGRKLRKHDTEARWAEAKSATACVALALHGATDSDLSGWKSRRQHRSPAMSIATKGVHKGATIGKDDVRDLRKTIDDILDHR